MKFVLIFGPHAVGKMTVGQELEKITNFKLFHNHMTIDLVQPFFGYDTKAGKRLVNLIRQEIFKEAAKNGSTGLIFTYVWAFDQKSDWDYVKRTCRMFESKKWQVYFVELESGLEERVERNKSPHRLAYKPSKRDIVRSEHELRKFAQHHRLNSEPGEMKHKNYLRIDNTTLSPQETAKLIKKTFFDTEELQKET